MNDIKRWSESESDADPVLRAVMRHAQSQEVGTEDMSQLVARLEARVAEEGQAPAPSPRRSSIRMLRRPRKVSPLVRGALSAAAMAASMGVAYAAWQGLAPLVRGSGEETPVVSAEPSSVARVSSAAKAARGTPAAAHEAEAPAEKQPSEPERPSERAAPSSSVHRPEVSPGTAAHVAAEDEASALEHARQTLSIDPARALAQLREHKAKYPASALGEEREVLAIEALMRLGRRDEAQARLGEFLERYPRSPYRRRLQTSVPSAP